MFYAVILIKLKATLDAFILILEGTYRSLHQLYLKEGHGGSIPHCPIFNPGLLRQVVC